MGLVFTILFGLVCIPCIVISGLNYWYTDFSWKEDGPWRYLSGLQVGAVVSVFFLFMMGVANFTCGKECKTFQIIFSVLLILCTFLALGVGIVVLIAGTIDKNNLSSKCQIEYKGMFEDFLLVDEVLQKANDDLCSSNCPCYFTDYGVYEELKTKYKNPDDLKIDDGGFINMKECFDKKKKSANLLIEEYIEGKNKKYNANKFAKFWKRIEEKFDCSGWCASSINKYLFSDINRGIPEHKCSTVVTKWLTKMVLAFGGLMVIIAGIMIIVIILAISDFADLTKNGPIYRPKEEEAQTMKYPANEKGIIGGQGPVVQILKHQQMKDKLQFYNKI